MCWPGPREQPSGRLPWQATRALSSLRVCGLSAWGRGEGAISVASDGDGRVSPEEFPVSRRRGTRHESDHAGLSADRAFLHGASLGPARNQPVPRGAAALSRVPAPAVAGPVCDPEPPGQRERWTLSAQQHLLAAGAERDRASRRQPREQVPV